MYRTFEHKNQKFIVIIHSDKEQTWIPEEPLNVEYREYLAWVAEGNVAEPWQPEESIIEETSPAEEPVIEDAN